MAKYPAAGRVKTRLAAVLGAERAAQLYRAFVLDLAERLALLPLPVVWAYLPHDAPFDALLPGARCTVQQGADLGERMHAAILGELATGADAVLVLGADVPHVDAAVIAEAEKRLAHDVDLVVGPAADGGYYLIGVRGPQAALFLDVAWGTATVLETTLARARALALRTHLLPQAFDVDDVDDLRALRALLAGGAVRLPRTAALLATFDGDGA